MRPVGEVCSARVVLNTFSLLGIVSSMKNYSFPCSFSRFFAGLCSCELTLSAKRQRCGRCGIQSEEISSRLLVICTCFRNFLQKLFKNSISLLYRSKFNAFTRITFRTEEELFFVCVYTENAPRTSQILFFC